MTTEPAEAPIVVATRTLSHGRSLTAAAQILNGPSVQRVKRQRNPKGMPWQQDAWAYFDEVGEFSWGIEVQALAVSKVRLVASRDVPGVDEPEIVTGEQAEGDDAPSAADRLAADLVAEFAGGSTGQQQLMYRVGVQLQVAAESYIVGRTVDGEEVWEAYSNEEVTSKQGSWSVNDGVEKFDLTDDDILIRVWRPHPRRREEPRSGTRALLPVLQEIKGLTASAAAQVDSRLAGAGLLLLPESMTMTSAPAADLEDGEDPFVAELIDAMITPINNRDSASAVVPIVIKVPDDSIGKAQYLRFDAPFDAKAGEQREKAIVRLARGMDLPPEQVLGMGDSNHWSAWMIDEATITGPISSLAAIITHALTIGWFRPALEELGVDAETAAKYLVWFDTTPLVQRPDRSGQALQVFDRGGISMAALVRESGFDEADMPQDGELCRQLLLALVKARPELASVLLDRLGVCAGIGDLSELDAPPGDVVPGEVTDTTGRALPERADQPPELTASIRPAEDSDCLLIACDVAVTRALEVAGKRMLTRTHRGQLKDVPPHLLHTRLPAVPAANVDRLVDGAWTSLTAALDNPDGLIENLDAYVRGLIESGQPHDREWLRPILRRHP